MTKLKIDKIRTDGNTQSRIGLSATTVAAYAEVIEDHRRENADDPKVANAWPFRDPVIVFFDGKDHWLADGFHRVAGCKNAGRAVVEADIRQGTQRDAMLYAAGANADHGLQRTTADKRRAVFMLLDDPEWAKWSDRQIARACRVSPTFVGNIRQSLTVYVDSERTYTTKHGTTATMKIGNIGSAPKLTKQQYIDQVLRPAVRDFCPRYTDEFNRSWSSIENPAHTNGTFWRQITRDFKAAGITYTDADLKFAIKAEIAVMTRELLERQAARPNPYMREDRPFDPEPPTMCPRQSCRHDFTKEPPLKLGIDHWRCPNCGREMDSNGRLPTPQNAPGEGDNLPEVTEPGPAEPTAADLINQCINAASRYAQDNMIPVEEIAANMLRHARSFDPGRRFLMEHLDAAAKHFTNGNGSAYAESARPEFITNENRDRLMVSWTPRLWCPACHQQGIVWAPAGGYGRCTCGNIVWTDGQNYMAARISFTPPMEKQSAQAG